MSQTDTPADTRPQTSARPEKGRRLKVLTYKDRYPSAFNSPRVSHHDVQPTLFLPFNKIQPNWDGFTLMPPVGGVDLVHAYNRIPLNAKRFICSFESSMPRTYGFPESSQLRKLMQSALNSPRCRRIIGMSHSARRIFLKQHENSPNLQRMKSKLMVRHPNVPLGAEDDALPGDTADELVVTFIGAHFGRKGGGACVRAAELALERKLPITFNIVSSMQYGADTWFDPTYPGVFERYLELLNLPNVRHLNGLPNGEVRNVLRNSHFCLLPTLGDTFGFSMIEAMAEHTPVIATRVNAVPEVVAEGYNGYMLDLPVNDLGMWIAPGYESRATEGYADHFQQANEDLAQQMVKLLETLVGQRETLMRLRRNSYTTVNHMFSATSQGALWDELYTRVAAEDASRDPVLDPALDISSPEDPLAFLKDKFV